MTDATRLERHLADQLNHWQIPTQVHRGLINHILYGRGVGQFLTAILEGNLFEACRRADVDTRQALFALSCFLFNDAPAVCYGTPARVQAWRGHGGLLGRGAPTPEGEQ